MDADMYVPIATIASFKMVKTLTDDVALITDVMRASKNVIIDPTGSKIKPNIQNQRNTLILRDIDSNANPDDVKAIFEPDFSKKISHIHPDIGNTWFISFEDENAALDALMYSRSRQFNGQPVKGRMKSESNIRNLIATTMDSSTAAPAGAPGAPPRPGVPFFPQPMAGGQPYMGGQQRYMRAPYPAYPGAEGYAPYYGQPYPGGGKRGGSPQNQPAGAPGAPGAPAPNAGAKGGPGYGKHSPTQYPVNVTAMNFPPLPSRPKTKRSPSEPVKKITKEEFLNVWQKLLAEGLKAPEALTKVTDCPVVLAEARKVVESTKAWPAPPHDEKSDEGEDDGFERQRTRTNSRGGKQAPHAQHSAQRRTNSRGGPPPGVGQAPPVPEAPAGAEGEADKEKKGEHKEAKKAEGGKGGKGGHPHPHQHPHPHPHPHGQPHPQGDQAEKRRPSRGAPAAPGAPANGPRPASAHHPKAPAQKSYAEMLKKNEEKKEGVAGGEEKKAPAKEAAPKKQDKQWAQKGAAGDAAAAPAAGEAKEGAAEAKEGKEASKEAAAAGPAPVAAGKERPLAGAWGNKAAGKAPNGKPAAGAQKEAKEGKEAPKEAKEPKEKKGEAQPKKKAEGAEGEAPAAPAPAPAPAPEAVASN
eukprot:tig00000498_g1673.t1